MRWSSHTRSSYAPVQLGGFDVAERVGFTGRQQQQIGLQHSQRQSHRHATLTRRRDTLTHRHTRLTHTRSVTYGDELVVLHLDDVADDHLRPAHLLQLAVANHLRLPVVHLIVAAVTLL